MVTHTNLVSFSIYGMVFKILLLPLPIVTKIASTIKQIGNKNSMLNPKNNFNREYFRDYDSFILNC